MNSLYLECETGISGDMIVAALLDLGADEQVLRDALKGIQDDGFSIEISRVERGGISCCDFRVNLDEAHENHDHDMDYLYGHLHGTASSEEDQHLHDHEMAHVHSHAHTHSTSEEHHHSHEHTHEHSHEHAHEHAHEHSHEHAHEHAHEHTHEHSHEHTHVHEHGHVHRGLKDVAHIIEGLTLTDGARDLALRTFTILAEAEAKAHGRSVGEVHFHEVGALDSIVDIVAAAVCFDNLQIGEVIIPGISEGRGTVRCQHGILPVPVPAVLNIAAACGLPLRITNRQGELVTPTGAAFAAAVMTSNKLPESMIPIKVGLGAGKREYRQPSILRAVLFESQNHAMQTDESVIWKLETNIDDCSGEQLGYVMDRLMANGARDVFYTPVYMKKNRPAYQLSVLTTEEQIAQMEEIIFSETTTIGIRRQRMERTVLPRRQVTVETPFGDAELKMCTYNGKDRIYPEYDSLVKIAKKAGIFLPEARSIVLHAWHEQQAAFTVH